MAEFSGFFADINGDREYTTDFLARWVASFIGNGIYNGTLAVTAGTYMQIVIPAGQGWINGYYYRNDSNLALAIANADGTLHRKDTVVLRWDVNTRDITVKVLQGTPAGSPTAPAITRTAEQYELKLAEISIPAGTTAITQALITDCRLNTAVCGIVTGVISQVETSTLYSQIQADLVQFKATNEADFTAWVNWLKTVLDEATAANLLSMIQDLQNMVSELQKPYNEIVHTNGIATIQPNTTNIFGTLTPISATISAPASGKSAEYIITFDSGATATSFELLSPSEIDWGNKGPVIIKTNHTHLVVVSYIGEKFKGYWR